MADFLLDHYRRENDRLAEENLRLRNAQMPWRETEAPPKLREELLRHALREIATEHARKVQKKPAA